MFNFFFKHTQLHMYIQYYKLLFHKYYYVCMYVHTYSITMGQPGKVASPVCGQLNRKIIFPCPCSRLRICSRETCSAVPSRVSLLISILWLNMVLTYGIPPEFRHGVHLFTYNRHTPSGQSRVYRVTQYCVPMAFNAESPPARGQ